MSVLEVAAQSVKASHPPPMAQMSVLEVYDASQHDLRVVDLAFGTSTANVSSWDATPLEVLHDSFYTKLPVTGLDVTRTARGITARQILMSTPTGAQRHCRIFSWRPHSEAPS